MQVGGEQRSMWSVTTRNREREEWRPLPFSGRNRADVSGSAMSTGMTPDAPSGQLTDGVHRRGASVAVEAQPSSRRYELDWLRVLIILGAMALHAVDILQARFPQVGSDVIRQIGSRFAIQWGLPALFLVAGASAWFSLADRSPRQFIRERVAHLLVPFIACAITIIPLSNYFASRTNSSSHISFAGYYGNYVQGYIRIFQGNPLDSIVSLWGVLWFIFMIFLLSLLTLPVVIHLRGSHGLSAVSRFAAMCGVPGGVLLVGLLFAACSWLANVVAPTTSVRSLWLVCLYALCYIAGGLLYAHPAIEQAVARDGPVALMLAAFCFVIEQIVMFSSGSTPGGNMSSSLTSALAGCVAWLGVIGFLGVSKRIFTVNNRAIQYLRVAVFPYFLLHMLALSLAGYVILTYSNTWGIVQAGAIIACSVAFLVFAYDGLIQRYEFLRVLFGLKSRTAE